MSSSNRAIFLVLIIVTLLGFIKRTEFYTFGLQEDIGRDLLVAKYFFTDHNTDFFLRPNSAAHILPNTPAYFWLVSLFYSITRSYYGVLLAQAVLQTLVIPLAFVTGKKLGNWKVGLVAAFLAAFSPTLIAYSHQLAQYSLLPFFVAWSFMHLAIAEANHKNQTAESVRRNSSRHLYLSIISYLPALLLHNSNLPLFIGLCGVWLWLGRRLGIRAFKVASALILTNLVTFLLLAYQLNFSLMFEVITLKWLSVAPHGVGILQRTTEILAFLLQLPAFSKSIWLVWLILLGTGVYSKRHRLSSRLVFLPILGIFLAILLPVTTFYPYYVVAPFIVLLLLLLSSLLQVIPQKFQLLVAVLIIGLYLFNSKDFLRYSYRSPDPFMTMAAVSKAVKDTLPPSETVPIVLPVSNQAGLRLSTWFSPSLHLYLLEDDDNFELVDSTVSHNNLRLGTTTNFQYVICIEYPGNEVLQTENCVSDWQRAQPVAAKLIPVTTYKEDNVLYSIFKTPETARTL